VEVVGEAGNGNEAVRLVEQLQPDVALMDVSMAGLNGLEATRRIVKRGFRTRVLILSMHADKEYVRQALVAGAAGYLLKNADRWELEMALRAVAGGQVWLSPRSEQGSSVPTRRTALTAAAHADTCMS